MNDAERDVLVTEIARLQSDLNELRKRVELRKKRTIADEMWHRIAGFVYNSTDDTVNIQVWSVEIALLPELVRAVRDGDVGQMNVILGKMGVE